ncbi:MAG: glycosyltransferase family 39 protein [Chlamydiota bacterium]
MTRKEKITLLMLLALAAGLRFHHLDKNSLWYDEAITAIAARGGMAGVIQHLTSEGGYHPPLDYLLVSLSLSIHQSDFFERLPSAIEGIAGVFLSFCFGRALWGTRFGLALCLCMAVSPAHVAYSQEGRIYSLFTTTSLAASYFLVRAIQAGRSRFWVAYAAALGLCLYSHCYAFYIVIAHCTALLLSALSKGPRNAGDTTLPGWRIFWVWVLAASAACFLYLPWLAYQVAKTFQYVEGTVLAPISAASPRSPNKLLGFFNFMLWGWAINPWTGWAPRFYAHHLVSCIFVYPLMILGFMRGWTAQRWKVILLACCGILPHLLLYCAVSLKPGFPWNPQYLLPTLPYYMALTLAGIFSLRAIPGLRPRAALYATAACLWALLCIELLSITHYFQNYRKENWRMIGDTLKSMSLPGDGFVVFLSHLQSAVAWYYNAPLEWYELDDERMFFPSSLENSFRHPRLWLLMGHIWDTPQWVPYRKFTREKIEERYLRVSQWHCGSDIELFLYERKASPPARGGVLR